MLKSILKSVENRVTVMQAKIRSSYATVKQINFAASSKNRR